jgi:Flp pilus assembly protein TadG
MTASAKAFVRSPFSRSSGSPLSVLRITNIGVWLRRHSGESGQAIIEVAMVLPLILLLVVGLIEFAFILNSRNTVGFASRDASMLASEGGSKAGTDCIVLDAIERDIVSPSRAVRITSIKIFWADRNGDQIGTNANVYARTGSTTCAYGDGTSVTVPFTLTTPGYIEDVRCDVLLGCGGAHSGLDTIGVQIGYQHRWLTSFASIMGSSTLDFTETSATRIEPQL